MNYRREIITIKIGSSVLLTNRGKLDELRIAQIANQIVHLQGQGYGIVLVVSGAVACGSKFTKLKEAAAGIGQVLVTATFHKIFRANSLSVAQILLTRNDLVSLTNQQNLARVINLYVRVGTVALINENDVVALNCFGGNDFLSVEVAKMLACRRLLILSTTKGSQFGVGGGEAKRKVVELTAQSGIDTQILNGKAKNILTRLILQNDRIGTRFNIS